MRLHTLGQLTPLYVEKASGDSTAPEMEKAHGGILNNPNIAAYVDEIGRRVLADSDRKDYPHAFKVLAASKVVNAFALGNGNVYVTLGLLRLLEDEAELAFVLGHEVGHVEKRHIAYSIDEALGGTLLLTLAEALVSSRSKGQQELVKAFGGTAANLVMLGFGRGRELEADDRGLKHSIASGYDPMAGARVFGKFQQLAPESKGLQVYMDSHPTASRRISEIQSEIRKKYPAVAGIANRDRYQAIVYDGAPYRSDGSGSGGLGWPTGTSWDIPIIAGGLIVIGTAAVAIASSARKNN